MQAVSMLLATLIFVPAGVAAELAEQKVSAGGVTVAVMPLNVDADAKTWEFKVVMDTHSADLNDDLMKSVVLVDGTGQRNAPISFDGAVPGGHHREGVLRFKPISPRPQSIQLQITRSGEAAPRVFRWALN